MELIPELATARKHLDKATGDLEARAKTEPVEEP